MVRAWFGSVVFCERSISPYRVHHFWHGGNCPIVPIKQPWGIRANKSYKYPQEYRVHTLQGKLYVSETDGGLNVRRRMAHNVITHNVITHNVITHNVTTHNVITQCSTSYYSIEAMFQFRYVPNVNEVYIDGLVQAMVSPMMEIPCLALSHRCNL